MSGILDRQADVAPVQRTMRVRNLSTLAYAQGYTAFHYKIAENEHPLDVLSPGYFDAIASMPSRDTGRGLVGVGDTIMATGATGAVHMLVTHVIGRVAVIPMTAATMPRETK